MSMPNILSAAPDIDIDRDGAVNLLIASVAFEELALAHIVNAEAEKIQFALGTLDSGPHSHPAGLTFDELIELNESAGRMLRKVVAKETILDFKLENAIKLMQKATPEKDPEITGLEVSYSDPVYTGHGNNRVGSTTVTLTFKLSDGTEVVKTETFNDINVTTSKNFSYTISVYYVTVSVTVTVVGVNNNMYITGATAEITSIVKP